MTEYILQLLRTEAENRWSEICMGVLELSQQEGFTSTQMNTNFTNPLNIKLLLKVVAKDQNCGFSFHWRS